MDVELSLDNINNFVTIASTHNLLNAWKSELRHTGFVNFIQP